MKGYELLYGRLYRVERDKHLYVIPKGIRSKSIVVKHHDLMGHFGPERTVLKIKEKYWFPKMREYVKRHIGQCAECLINKVPGGKRPGALHPAEPPSRPFEKIHMDHVGPFMKTPSENAYILVIIDALTKFVRLYPVTSTGARENLLQLKKFVNNYGVPRKIVTDRGVCFTGKEFEEYCDSIGAKHYLISTRWPQSNGQVERVMRTLIPTLTCSIDEEDRWDIELESVERKLNTAMNKTTGKTPFEVLYCFLPEFTDAKLSQCIRINGDEEWQPPVAMRNEVRENIRRQQQKYKEKYDKRKFHGVTYNVGDIVLMRVGKPTRTGQPTKLCPAYRGPLVVTAAYPANDTYRVSSIDGTGDRSYSTTANVSQLKLYRTPTEEDDNSEDGETNEENSQAEEVRVRPKREVKMPSALADYDLN